MALAVRTRLEWAAHLSGRSEIIAKMRPAEIITKDAALNGDAINFANNEAHNRLIIRATEGLVGQDCMSVDEANRVLVELLTRNTYGAFSELAGYDWILRSRVLIAASVELSSLDVLGINGSTLDGKFRYADVFFDLKAFGLHGRLAARLKQRLEEALPEEQVFVEESWDLSEATFAQLIADAPAIAAQLKEKRMVRKGTMNLRVQAPKRVSVSGRVIQPYLLAKENALYPFKDAHQFTRNAPFILVLVLHPWLNANAFGEDFAGVDTCFTRALARRAFIQFSDDARPLNAVCNLVDSTATLADASRLLSAIFFVDVWPIEDDLDGKRSRSCWLYRNPRASHPLNSVDIDLFRFLNPNGTYIDDFAYDDY
jgi:hypothetical protein